jgi:hypothetical protein
VQAYVAGGSLFVMGDGSDNDVVVRQSGAHAFDVSSGASVTTVNGAAGPVSLAGVAGDLWAFLGDGNDRLDVRSSALPGGLWFFGADGNNTLAVDGTAPSVGGGVNVFNGSGNQAVTLAGVAVAGSFFESNGTGSSATNVTDSTFGGAFAVYNRGGGAIASGPAAGYATDAEITSSMVNGPATFVNDLGADRAIFATATVHGPVTVIDGPGAAWLAADHLSTDSPMFFSRADGGDLPDRAGTAGYFSMASGRVHSNLTVFNGSGKNVLILDTVKVYWDLFIQNGAGRAECRIFDSSAGNNITILNAGSSDPQPDGFATVTYLGKQQTANLGEMSTSGSFAGWNLTTINGAGNDQIALDEMEVETSLYINNGPGGAEVIVNRTQVDFSAVIVRGDGGALPADVGNAANAPPAGRTTISASEFDSPLLLMSGAGEDRLSVSDTLFLSDLTVFNGTGASRVDLAGTFNGSVWVFGSTSDSSQVRVVSAAGATAVGGTLWIQTGAGNDSVAIDDSSLAGLVYLATDPGSPADNADTVAIERTTGDSGSTTFHSRLIVNTGAGNDSAAIGVNGNSNCHAHFVVGFLFDGGAETDSLNYLLNGNQIDLAPTITGVENIT